MRRLSLLILVAALSLFACACKKEAAVETMAYDAQAYAGFRDTLLYYASDEGLLVPFMRQIPWEEGIGKAALGYLVDTEENRAVLQRYGLRAPLPDGTAIRLRIDDNKQATVELSSCAPPDDAAQEYMRIASVVNTLTEFPTIDTVSVNVNGEPIDRFATDSDSAMSAFALNAEDSAAPTSTGALHAMTLYFPNASASLNVPVTRYQRVQPTFASAVQGLIDGPQSSALTACFPTGTALLDATIEDGAATVNFSKEFALAAETDGLLEAARDTLYFTACGFTDVQTLDILVEGEPLAADAAAVSLPLYPNSLE